MRHFVGFIMGIVAAPVMIGGAGWAAKAWTRAGHPNPAEVVPSSSATLLIGVTTMLGLGLLLGLIMATRISPLAALIASLAMLGATGYYMVQGQGLFDLIPIGLLPWDVVRGMEELMRWGIYAALGAALFVPVLVPSKWRAAPDEMEEELPPVTY